MKYKTKGESRCTNHIGTNEYTCIYDDYGNIDHDICVYLHIHMCFLKIVILPRVSLFIILGCILGN